MVWDVGDEGGRCGKWGEARRRRFAVVISGDMSHTHRSDGPYGYADESSAFDAAVGRWAADPCHQAASLLEEARYLQPKALSCGFTGMVLLHGMLCSDDDDGDGDEYDDDSDDNQPDNSRRLQEAPGGSPEGGSRRLEEAPGGSKRLEEAPEIPGGSGRLQEAPEGSRRLQEVPEDSQEAPGGPRRPQEAQGEPRELQKASEGFRRLQEAPEGSRRLQIVPDESRRFQMACFSNPEQGIGSNRVRKRFLHIKTTVFR